MKRKTTLFLPIFLLLTILLTVSASAAAFEDVPEDAYFAPAVQWALDNGVTTGTSSTTFSPDATCTRGQVVTFLWRASGCPEPEAGSCPFTDVAPGSYYEKAVLWAVEYGITNGTSATEFSPDALCTSAHILTFLFRSLEEAQPVITETLPGVDPNAYYARSWTWAANNDMLQDMDDFERAMQAIDERLAHESPQDDTAAHVESLVQEEMERNKSESARRYSRSRLTVFEGTGDLNASKRINRQRPRHLAAVSKEA